MSDFATLAAAIHATAQEKGWWEEFDAKAPASQVDLDLEGAIEAKVAFNATRPHRHGGKKA